MRRCLVTGGSGFLGRHLIDHIISNCPKSEIVVFDIRPYEHHDPATASSIIPIAGNITQLGDIITACRDVDTVFHLISANPLDNRNDLLMWRVNVEGTKNVIEACKQSSVQKLVYISSASVVFNGSHVLGGDESIPYPSRFIDHYSKTKAEAEKLVLAANKNTMLTCALRPSAIFGERDPIFLPRLIEAGRAGKTKYMIGNGKTKWEFTYVGNVAAACLQAAGGLKKGSPVAGSAYFITNDETTLFWEQCGLFLEALGFPKPSVSIPYIVCLVLAVILELVLFLISPVYKPKKPPTFSRQRVQLLTTHREFSCAKAKRDFGYKPDVSMEEATRRTVEYFKPLARLPETDKKEE